MIEALWSVSFDSSLSDSGAGVAVLETEKVLGGDSSYIYVGSYTLEGDLAKVRIKVTHYAGQPNSVFGHLKEFNLVLSGKPSRNEFILEGAMAENPNLTISIKLVRRAELP